MIIRARLTRYWLAWQCVTPPFCFVLAFQVTPNQLLYQQKRFRSKINIQKPRKPHYLRGLVNTFLTPFYEDPQKDKTYVDVCQNVLKETRVRPVEPYDEIIAREIRNWFDKSKMIGIVHRNSMTAEECFEQVLVPFKRVNMYYKSYGNPAIKLALNNSPYEALTPLVCSYYGIIFSPEENVAALEKVVNKCPQLTLLAGILKGRLLDRDSFIKFGKMDITTAQSDLVYTLQNAGGNNLTQQLTHHQSTLVMRLKQIGSNENAPDENQNKEPV